MKKIWLTSMASASENIGQVVAGLEKYGLAVAGHLWKDDNQKMAWWNATEALVNKEVELWAIIGSGQELTKPSVLYGLSMLAIAVRSKRNTVLPVVFLQSDANLISSDDLPSSFKGADVLATDNPALGAKLVAKVHQNKGKIISDYHIDVQGNEQIGQWFEVGPANKQWQGIMFGVTGAKIAFQAVGPSGKLPDKSVLEYPMQGMTLNLNQKDYVTWSVQNSLPLGTSYYAKVTDHPESIIFGPYSVEKETDVFVVHLK